jgi:membrane-associated phospholipid phosphatase
MGMAVDWLAAKERALFFAIDGHPPWPVARLLASLLLTVSAGDACWWVLFGLYFLVGRRRGRRVAVTGALALLLAHGAAWGLRGLVQRAAPGEVYGAAVFVLPRFAPAFAFLARGGDAPATFLRVVAALLCAAGVYAGVHFPSDAAAGALLGALAARAAVWLLGDPFRRRTGTVLPFRRRGEAVAARPQGPPRPRRRSARGRAR